MGVMLDEVVKAQHPEHADHVITIKKKGSPVVPDATWWSCSCGIDGTFGPDDIGRALREGLVTRT